jgi:penicillin G amidase
MRRRSWWSPARLLPLSLLATAACHPLACCTPADLPKDAPLVVKVESDQVGGPVDVVYDDLGIPHIYGENEVDLAHALGFMHGRDRQFQILLYVHAGQGRLTEILGEDMLPVDRDNRLLTHNLDAQIAAMGERDRAIVLAYADGLNQGAKATGRSAEMQILGLDWEDVGIPEILAVLRLQQWSQSVGLDEELSRHRLRKTTSPAVFDELWADVSARGEAIVAADAHTGDAFAFGPDKAKIQYHRAPTTTSSTAATTKTQRAKPRDARRAMVEDELTAVRREMIARFGGPGQGASNSWAVDGTLTDSGDPVLCNDPHLGHSAPGVFYMVHMEGPDFSVVGGTFPGLPAVLIGHGRHVAWGITNAYADIMDVVELQTLEADRDIYVVDGNPINLRRVTQRFKMGKADDSEIVEETFHESIFGPVLPPRYGEGTSLATPKVDDDERLVMQWTATHFVREQENVIGAFWDLAKAKNIDEVHAAVQDFAAPAMSLAIAIKGSDDGDAGIHYRLSGIIPIRGDDQRVDVPRQGLSRQSGFVGVLPAAQKPQLDNPAGGYLVASNQRIVDNGVLSQRFVGYEGARPFRANRIHERLRDLFEGGAKASRDELCSIQQEVGSIEAREVAPILGKHCPDSVGGFNDDVVANFCAAVGDFDGFYTLESTAIPFARLMRAVTEETLLRHMDRDLMDDVITQTFVQMALHEAILAADRGEASPALFDDPETPAVEDLADVVAAAAPQALEIVRAEVGENPADWQWQKQHTLSFRNPLASAPVIGGLFATAERPESGTGAAPRAEAADPTNGLKCRFGAGLRLHAEMSAEPTIGMINDIGNSGHFGHRHLEDQYPLWTKGETRALLRAKDDVVAANDGQLRLEP